MKKLIEVKDLVVKFRGNKTVLDKVSFSINQNELVSVIGLNGSGKSTLLHAMVGLVKPVSGEVKRYTDKIFFIPQHSDFDSSFPVTVKEFLELYGAKNPLKYLERAGVKMKLNDQISSLSGGEFQRVLIALALSKKPELLLMDEPTSGIDLVGESSFYKLIEDIRKEFKVSIVLVSHDIHLVVKHASKVLCLSNHVCCQGSPAEVAKEASFKELFGPYLTPYIHNHDHTH